MFKIGYVGDGVSASRFANCLMRRHSLHVVDARLDVAAVPSTTRLATVSDGRALFRECDVIFVCLSAPDGLHELLAPHGLLDGLNAGTIVVDQADSDPDRTRVLSKELAKRNVSLIDVSVSGHYAANTPCPPIVLAGEPESVFERISSLLECFGDKIFYCGKSGNAQALNLLNSTLAMATQLATLEAVAMGSKCGLDVETMSEVISKGSGRNRTSQIILPGVVAGQPVSEFPLSRALQLLERFTNSGQRNGSPLFIANIAKALVQAAVNKFGESASVDRTVELVEGMAKANLTVPRPAHPADQDGNGSAFRVGYVGIGTMGGALARRLMLSRPMTVFDINKNLVETLVSEGATPVASAAELARQCDVIMMCVPTSAIARQVVFGPGGLAEGLSPGKIVIDQTTGNPSETRSIAVDLADMGVAMIDAPVSGGTRGAVAGTIAIICGGPPETFEQVRPILAQISPNIIYCGRIGNGHAAKLVQNVVGACNRVTTLECLAAACKGGLTLSEMIAPIDAGSGWNGATERVIPALRTYSATTDFAIGLMVKDLRLAMIIGNEVGAPMLIPNAVHGLYEICAYEVGSAVNVDEIAKSFESISGVKFGECA